MTTDSESSSEWLTTDDLSEKFKVPIQTVRAWRHYGTGPKGVRLGRHVRYRSSDVEAWIAAQELAQRA